jgi:hypothetical protein
VNHSFEHLVCEFWGFYLIHVLNVAVNQRSLVKDSKVVWAGLWEDGVSCRTCGQVLELNDPTIRFVL